MAIHRSLLNAIKLFISFFLLTSYVVPPKTILLDMNFIRQIQNKGNGLINKPSTEKQAKRPRAEVEEYDWEDYDTACTCLEADCECKRQAFEGLKELEEMLLDEENVDDPFQFLPDHEADDEMDFNTEDNDRPAKAERDEAKKTAKGCENVGARRHVRTSPTVLHTELRTTKCCSKDCLKRVPLEVALKKREDFWLKKTLAGQRNAMLTSLESAEEDEQGRRFFHIGCASAVCRKAWCVVYGIKDTRYKDILRLYKEGIRNVDGKRVKPKSVAYDIAKEWMRRFALTSDVMPTTGKRHLPSCLTKQSVYMLYTEDIKIKKYPKTLSRIHFGYMWKQEFPYVVIPKQSRFTKCSICVYLKKQLLNPRLSKEKRIRLTNIRKVHLLQQMTERQKYYKHGLKAALEPNKYLSIIIDGMDQSKTYLPHFTEKSKADENLWKLQMHVTGVLVNARSASYCFMDCREYPHDSNFTMNILLNVLEKEQKKNGKLPPNLYVQMDNCGRENKNKFVLAFLAILVHFDIFKKIRVGFLMVGHTHEDIDQLFSRISKRLAKNDALTIETLAANIKESYNPVPLVEQILHMFEIRKWVEPVMNDLSGHSEPHQFKLEKNEKGKVQLYYKKWSSTKEWKEAESFLRTDAKDQLLVSETIKPGTLPLNLEKANLQKLEVDIPKYNMKLDQDAQDWWKQCIEDLRHRASMPLELEKQWPLEALKAKPVDVNQETPESMLTNQEAKEAAEIEKLFAKERRETTVVVKIKKTDNKTRGRKRKVTSNKEPIKKKASRKT